MRVIQDCFAVRVGNTLDPNAALRTAEAIVSGSGYNVGDTITLAGGSITPAVVEVTNTTSGGAISTVLVTTGGEWTPPFPPTLTQTSTSGSGLGAVFQVPTHGWSPYQFVGNVGFLACKVLTGISASATTEQLKQGVVELSVSEGGTLTVQDDTGSPVFTDVTTLMTSSTSGITCFDEGSGVPGLQLLEASDTQAGAVNTVSQTFGGQKTFIDPPLIVCPGAALSLADTSSGYNLFIEPTQLTFADSALIGGVVGVIQWLDPPEVTAGNYSELVLGTSQDGGATFDVFIQILSYTPGSGLTGPWGITFSLGGGSPCALAVGPYQGVTGTDASGGQYVSGLCIVLGTGGGGGLVIGTTPVGGGTVGDFLVVGIGGTLNQVAPGPSGTFSSGSF